MEIIKQSVEACCEALLKLEREAARVPGNDFTAFVCSQARGLLNALMQECEMLHAGM